MSRDQEILEQEIDKLRADVERLTKERDALIESARVQREAAIAAGAEAGEREARHLETIRALRARLSSSNRLLIDYNTNHEFDFEARAWEEADANTVALDASREYEQADDVKDGE